ncbi:hypothetical protein KEH51_03705 [[Brevibacterium] frigoritolerans]|uniref:Uncharacterized protein n=1 Tax=Peribacillus frigoritolerans TaxID=450367 RepID=A0A941J630_9BACI|nr:hypothetical protein [Peribacillus frigoritolerans]
MNKMMPEKKSLNPERAVVSPGKRAMDDAAQSEEGQAELSAIPERKPEEGRVMPKEETLDIAPAFWTPKPPASLKIQVNLLLVPTLSPSRTGIPISGDGYQEAVLTETAESGQGNGLEVFGSVEADDNPYYVFRISNC